MFNINFATVQFVTIVDVLLVSCLEKSFDKDEKLDWKPLYLDAQATTPMVGNVSVTDYLSLEVRF